MKPKHGCLVIAGVAAAGVMALFSRLYFDVRFSNRHADRLYHDLGFQTGSPYIKSGERTAEPMTFENLDTNGVMYAAGVRDDDIYLGRGGSLSLTRLLQESRGSVTLQTDKY